jgi:hypothetical protein
MLVGMFDSIRRVRSWVLHFPFPKLHQAQKRLTVNSSCYCTDILPPTLQPLANDVNCTFPCPSKSSEACGGPIDEATQEPSALSLYDSKPPAPITYPDWQYDGCVEHFSAVGNLTHVATRDRITVEGCLNACDQANLKYEFAGLSGQYVAFLSYL